MTVPSTYHRFLHIVALITACAVFPLVIVGAGVTSKDAGMAYADWPTSGGRLINPEQWWQQDDTRWEHGHRLIGWSVGILSIAVAVMAFPAGGIVRWGGAALLLAIIVQGVAGGLRVREVSTTLAMIHGIWGQLCFALACVVALISTRNWVQSGGGGGGGGLPSPYSAFTQRLCVVVALAIFIQLVLGAVLRHFGADAALAAHLVWVVAVSFAVGWATLWIMANHPGQASLVRLVQILAILLAVQLMLGAFAFLVTYMPGHWSPVFRWAIPSAHVAVGALLLGDSVMLAALSYRLLQRAPGQASATAIESNVKVAPS